MNLSEVLAAFTAAMDAMKAVSGEVAALRSRVATLEAQVAEHDKELKSAPEPGLKEN